MTSAGRIKPVEVDGGHVVASGGEVAGVELMVGVVLLGRCRGLKLGQGEKSLSQLQSTD